MNIKSLAAAGLLTAIMVSLASTASANDTSEAVGIRAYEEEIGNTVLWDGETKKITVLSGGAVLYTGFLGEDSISFGDVSLQLDANLEAPNGVTYLGREILDILHGPKPVWMDGQLLIPAGFFPEINTPEKSFLLKSREELKAFCADYGESTKVLLSLYGEQFFERENLALGYVSTSSTAQQLAQIKAVVQNETLEILYCMASGGIGAAVMGGNLIAVEVPKTVTTVTLSGDLAISGYSYDFERSTSGFEAVFADYHDDGNDFSTYEMQAAYKTIPVDGKESRGLYISSQNRSDDMFMGYLKELTGLESNKDYTFEISFKLATNVDGGMIGVGGSPGASVTVKAGLVAQRPVIKEDELGVYRFTNVDTGVQANSGKDLQALGNMEKPSENHQEGFVFKDFWSTVTVRTNENGAVYLIIGTDSGFEGFTEYYIDDVALSVK